MAERISFVIHEGQRVMVIDLRGWEPKQLLAILDEVQHTIALEARDSLLTLADFSGAHVDREVATRIKEVLTRDRPFVKRSAWVGKESLPKVYFENFKSFSRREIGLFDTRAEAMEWLVKKQ